MSGETNGGATKDTEPRTEGRQPAPEGAAPGDRAYLGSFTSAGGRGITTAAVDPVTGALTARHHTGAALADPSYLVLSGTTLYAVSETDEGAAAAFSLRDPDRPALLGAAVPVGGAAPTHLCVTPGRLHTANYGSGSVSSLELRADGTPAGPALVHQHHGDGPDPDRQRGPHAHAVTPDPSGRWLLSTDLGTDEVWRYALGPDGGGPRPVGATALRPGTGPRHLVFHPDGSRAYVVNELSSSVTVCGWDASTGTLEPRAEMPTVPDADGPDGAGAENYPSELVVSKDGRFGWVANRGHDSIAVLALLDSGDRPELITTVPCGGHWPRDLALHPTGRWLYAANERSGDVTWFEVDTASGTPHRTGSLPVPAASRVAFAALGVPS